MFKNLHIGASLYFTYQYSIRLSSLQI